MELKSGLQRQFGPGRDLPCCAHDGAGSEPIRRERIRAAGRAYGPLHCGRLQQGLAELDCRPISVRLPGDCLPGYRLQRHPSNQFCGRRRFDFECDSNWSEWRNFLHVQGPGREQLRIRPGINHIGCTYHGRAGHLSFHCPRRPSHCLLPRDRRQRCDCRRFVREWPLGYLSRHLYARKLRGPCQ